MKISVIDYYNSGSSPHKDPVLIPQSLRNAGFDVELVSRAIVDIDNLFGFRLFDLNSWLSALSVGDKPHCVIAISRFDVDLSSVLEIIKSHSIPLILKGDTDGTLGYPLVPNYLRAVPIFNSPLNILRHLKWRLPIKKIVGKKLLQFESADYVVYESPGAGVNLAFLLNHWKFRQHIHKLIFIPNSVSDYFTKEDLPNKEGLRVVAIGRWDDRQVKGTNLLISVITNVLEDDKEISFSIVGSGSEIVKEGLSEELHKRVDFVGQLDSLALRKLLSESKIMFVPSRVESFSIASAEALCCGCSLVVTPIESLIYLSGGGEFGSVSRGFTRKSLLASLAHEIQAWRSGIRDAKIISGHWRHRLSQTTVERRWVELISRIVK